MKNCCVPFCKSKSINNKLRFFQIPNDLKLRTLWLVAIKRRGEEPGTLWQPNEYSVVCEKHFTDDDFSKTYTKIQRLLPGTVPSVFEEYPLYAKPKECSKKRKSPISELFENPLKKACFSQNSCETEKLTDASIQNISTDVESKEGEKNSVTFVIKFA